MAQGPNACCLPKLLLSFILKVSFTSQNFTVHCRHLRDTGVPSLQPCLCLSAVLSLLCSSPSCQSQGRQSLTRRPAVGPSCLCGWPRQPAVGGSGWPQGCKKEVCSQVGGSCATVAPMCGLGNGPVAFCRPAWGLKGPGILVLLRAGGQTKFWAADPRRCLLPMQCCHQRIPKCRT